MEKRNMVPSIASAYGQRRPLSARRLVLLAGVAGLGVAALIACPGGFAPPWLGSRVPLTPPRSDRPVSPMSPST